MLVSTLRSSHGRKARWITMRIFLLKNSQRPVSTILWKRNPEMSDKELCLILENNSLPVNGKAIKKKIPTGKEGKMTKVAIPPSLQLQRQDRCRKSEKRNRVVSVGPSCSRLLK
ncbi:pre-mRNA-splicing factor cef1 [Histoplasma capsulatum G186AR]|uniref:Pre-mRNA-splicing factor cef1 n=1 Tax=Ajellomyces capsulatus TaxID=5037 RepID=A0A8H7Z5Y9_AJECA|nr:pre-mRNA-splicing factor cef1 [Histoplasma capsulatum]QSS75679.1 pre-mRNA-splicing factor cef1 [Histoplasma capsulatum G186AR]